MTQMISNFASFVGFLVRSLLSMAILLVVIGTAVTMTKLGHSFTEVTADLGLIVDGLQSLGN